MFIFIKILKEGVVLALQELWSNKLRSFLSVLGITIGIFCVISVLMMVESVERNVRSSFSRLGSDVLYITRESWGEDPAQNWWKYAKRPYPNYDEFKAVSEKVPSAAVASIRIILFEQELKSKNNTIQNSIVVGASHNFATLYSLEFSEGRYFSPSGSLLGSNSIILGSKIAEELFPVLGDPLGKQVKVMGRKLKVVGVLQQEGESILGSGLDEAAIVPYNYLRRYVNVDNKAHVPLISIKAEEGVPLEQLKEDVRAVLRAKRRLKPKEEDSFAMNQASILTGLIDNVFGIVNFAGWLIGCFSILVGGFGIANIMFVSVKERTGIIGIKKSLGAKSHFILFEFLIESICLCIVGGLFGLLLVAVLALIGNQFIDSFDLILSVDKMYLGIFLSVLIGCISGFIPALNAARMNPVEAIRQNF